MKFKITAIVGVTATIAWMLGSFFGSLGTMSIMKKHPLQRANWENDFVVGLSDLDNRLN